MEITEQEAKDIIGSRLEWGLKEVWRKANRVEKIRILLYGLCIFAGLFYGLCVAGGNPLLTVWESLWNYTKTAFWSVAGAVIIAGFILLIILLQTSKVESPDKYGKAFEHWKDTGELPPIREVQSNGNENGN